MNSKVNCHYLQPDKKKKSITRLNRIEGQIRGVGKMIEDRRSCVEVLNQLTSIEKALRGVKQVVFRNYLETCATKAIKASHSEGTYDDLMEVIYKYS